MVLDGHTGNVTAVSFHLEGKWLVTGSEDGTIKIWDLRYEPEQASFPIVLFVTFLKDWTYPSQL